MPRITRAQQRNDIVLAIVLLLGGLLSAVLSSVSGLYGDQQASLALAEAGWTVAGQGNADGSAPATVVYYSEAGDEAVALGVARDLGSATVELSDQFPDSSVTVVLGADYSP